MRRDRGIQNSIRDTIRGLETLGATNIEVAEWVLEEVIE